MGEIVQRNRLENFSLSEGNLGNYRVNDYSIKGNTRYIISKFKAAAFCANFFACAKYLAK